MAHILSFTVDGLAGRQSPLTLNLNRDVNLFWGLNGSGKTSLLNILSSALANQTKPLQDTPFRSAEVVVKLQDGGKTLRRSISKPTDDELQSINDDIESSELEPVGDGLWREVVAKPVWGWTTEIVDDDAEGTFPRLNHASLKHTYLPISRVSSGRSRTSGGMIRSNYSNEFDDAFLSTIFEEQIRSKWQRYNSTSLTQIRNVQQQGLASILAVVFGGAVGTEAEITVSRTGEMAYKVINEFLSEQDISLKVGISDFIARYEDQHDLQEVVSRIDSVTRDVDEILRPQREFQSIIDALYSGNKHLELEDRPSQRRPRNPIEVKVGGERIPLKSLSSGEKQLLQIMLEVLAAEESSVLIDEPELSMHVDWQYQIVRSMQKINARCQIILATHSPEVMADVPDKYVFELA